MGHLGKREMVDEGAFLGVATGAGEELGLSLTDSVAGVALLSVTRTFSFARVGLLLIPLPVLVCVELLALTLTSVGLVAGTGSLVLPPITSMSKFVRLGARLIAVRICSRVAATCDWICLLVGSSSAARSKSSNAKRCLPSELRAVPRREYDLTCFGSMDKANEQSSSALANSRFLR